MSYGIHKIAASDKEPTKHGLNIWMPMHGQIVEPMPMHAEGATRSIERKQGPTARGDKRGVFVSHPLFIIQKTVKLRVNYAPMQHNDRGLLICHQSQETIPYPGRFF